jgi:hypothetical protein
LKLKIDENLPLDCAAILRAAGFEADTVFDERLVGADDSEIAARSRAEHRVLVTLDLDFSNIQAYPPSRHAGIIVPAQKARQAHCPDAHVPSCSDVSESSAGWGTLDRGNGSNSLPRGVGRPLRA